MISDFFGGAKRPDEPASDIALVTHEAIPFGQHFAASHRFDEIFTEGMALVERTAAYLDGEGRRAAKTLTPPLAATYATESMRLTTRLLEVASWLLVRRSLRDGEITADEARAKRSRIKLAGIARPGHIKHYEQLPDGLRTLIAESYAMNDRITQLDASFYDAPPEPLPQPVAPSNPVQADIVRLQSAFGRRAS
ncbi:MAG: DUF1465 family protein [Pseudomonadota bacterium]